MTSDVPPVSLLLHLDLDTDTYLDANGEFDWRQLERDIRIAEDAS